MTTKRTGYSFVGALPPAKWEIALLIIQGQPDAIIAVDKSGRYPPRIIIDGELQEVRGS